MAKYRSVFDIIGPIMIGPSSSHTAGAARIGRVARHIFGNQPDKAIITLYGSFAQTYRGHGTDVAIVGGLLNFDTDDDRIPQSLQLAEELGMAVTFFTSDDVPTHPNTARIRLVKGERALEVVGISVGGGKIEIVEVNGFELEFTGENAALLVLHEDRFGMIAKVCTILANHEINIGQMKVARKEKGKEAMMLIEVDQNMDESLLREIEEIPYIRGVCRIEE
ncbi:L-serine ammonia-lyase, iron-sulfur-dependent subunit beta [Rubeoparvulum massiliense]|uniref:L-serine ammonia-lyase, iron-sulfur-dependent subunit beta n=1 Tax=Rubeoparvulum massiliense TaxID=1631346 RepID=UPI00065E0BC0|nr:L-serine ammonia-lyase, iron-sulfur-dependent subunit beta [Rubeoparvulum massiliense]